MSSSVADSESCQVVKEILEIKGRQRRFESHLTFMEPAKGEDRKHIIYSVFVLRSNKKKKYILTGTENQSEVNVFTRQIYE